MLTRMLSVAVAVTVLGFVAAPYQLTCQEKADLSRMQGEWEWSSCPWTLGGPATPVKRFLVTGTTLTTWQGTEKTGEWKLRLDASRSPRAFDATPATGGQTQFGTYEFVGGGLHLRWGASPDGGGATSLVLSRPTPLPSAMPAALPSPGEARAASVRVPPPPMLR